MMKKTAVIPILLLFFALFSNDAAAAGYMKFDGVDGESKNSQFEGFSDLQCWTYGIEIPTSQRSGRATGKRQHRPFTVTKPLDKASPLLMKKCITGEVIRNAKIEYTRTNDDGREESYYTVELTNVRIVSYNIDCDDDTGATIEDITLSFEKIKVTYANSQVEFTDNWEFE